MIGPASESVSGLASAGGPTLVAIDLGAESCRVSLLAWQGAQPHIRVIHRFPNAPWDSGPSGLRWNLNHICHELEAGLRACAECAHDAIAAVGATGWGVDYVRLNRDGTPIEPPFCYRDPRTQDTLHAVHALIAPDRLYAATGVQIQPLNTIYQLYADKLAGAQPAPWVMLPEYILHWLGAPRIAEYTNATHTALVDPGTRSWSGDLFTALGLDRASAPEIVSAGSLLGPLRSDLRSLPAYAHAQLIAPACHDTASAVAGIPSSGDDWAYISSGTWSLVGMVQSEPQRTPEAFAADFTNLGAAGGGVLFHCGLAGMWLLRQCMNTWENERAWRLDDLVAAAEQIPPPDAVLDLDDPAFVAPGDMPSRINAQRIRRGLPPLPEDFAAAPHYASLLFHSLASRYGVLLNKIADLTRRRPNRICVVGGGSRNAYLNALTHTATGLPVERCSTESSTLGNFAVQWARLDQSADGVTSAAIAARARALAGASLDC